MSTQKGNVKRTRPQKFQNKARFKNLYHDTSIQTQRILNTDVTGVCARCKECIDWKIKYKKYKPLTQPRTCAMCKQKTVKLAYHVFCTPCSTTYKKCAKCGDKKEAVLPPKLSAAEQASEDRELQFELEQLPERKRRTFLRLQEKGLLTGKELGNYGDNDSDDCSDDNDDGDFDDECGDELETVDDIGDRARVDCAQTIERGQSDLEVENESVSAASADGIAEVANQIAEDSATKNDCNKDPVKEANIEKLSID